MTDMEAKARELRKELNWRGETKTQVRELLTKALTEAHREGMEEAAKVEVSFPVDVEEDDGRCMEALREGFDHGVNVHRAAIREKINDVQGTREKDSPEEIQGDSP